MSDLERLWRLQELDRERDQLQRQLQEHPLWQRLQQTVHELEQLQGRLQQCQRELPPLRLRVRQGEREVQALEAEIRQLEQKLFGGTVSHPRELSGLQHRLEKQRQQLERLQEQVLQEMMRLEETEQRLQQLTERHRELQQQADRHQREWDEVRQKLERRLAELEAQREQLVAQIEQPEWLQRYQRLYGPKGGQPVAAVADGRCTACGAPVPTLLLEALRRPQRPVLCEVCGRILMRPAQP